MGRSWCGWCCCGARSTNSSKIPNKTLKEEVDEEDEEDFYKVRFDHATGKLLKTINAPEQVVLELNTVNASAEDDEEASNDRQALKK